MPSILCLQAGRYYGIVYSILENFQLGQGTVWKNRPEFIIWDDFADYWIHYKSVWEIIFA